MSYTWIAFYEQLADKLVAWRDRQPELLAVGPRSTSSPPPAA